MTAPITVAEHIAASGRVDDSYLEGPYQFAVWHPYQDSDINVSTLIVDCYDRDPAYAPLRTAPKEAHEAINLFSEVEGLVRALERPELKTICHYLGYRAVKEDLWLPSGQPMQQLRFLYTSPATVNARLDALPSANSLRLFAYPGEYNGEAFIAALVEGLVLSTDRGALSAHDAAAHNLVYALKSEMTANTLVRGCQEAIRLPVGERALRISTLMQLLDSDFELGTHTTAELREDSTHSVLSMFGLSEAESAVLAQEDEAHLARLVREVGRNRR